ncbi:MAG TPA: HDIG domain-containing protein [Gemmatimonadota bacterium]|nr:HDIG domain-containing protein [Gemmatimonadota bacterium]
MSSGRARGLRERLARLEPSGDPTAPVDLAWRVAVVGAVALLTLVLFPPRGGHDVPPVRAGTVATEDVIAPFDFAVPREEQELARRQEQAALTVPPVYVAVPAAADSALARLDAYLARAEAVSEGEEPVEPLDRVGGRDPGLRPAELRRLQDPAVRERLREFAARALPGVYRETWFLPAAELAGIASAQIALQGPDREEEFVPRSALFALSPGADVPGLSAQGRTLDDELETLALQLLPAVMPPNLRPQPSLTALRRSEARAAVSPIAGEVLSGELIVAARTRVTPEQEAKVRALQGEIEDRRSGPTPEDLRAGMGRFALAAALLFLFGFYLFSYRRDVFDSLRSVGVMGAIWALLVVLASFADRVEAVPSYAVPVALASVLVAVLWDTRLSAVTTLFLAVYLGSQGELGFPLLWTGVLGGLAGAWSVRRIRRRTHFYESLLFVVAGHSVAIGALALMRLWGWGDAAQGLSWGALSAALAVFFAMGLLPILEWASGRTTDLTLLELADLNRPLLKRLQLEAPGTYHHSIIVGNLAESAADGIGANSLLARVGAYYHDIGKMECPEYFVENQRQGVNPHDALPPRASARIVIRHVTDGVDMASAAGLPDVVVDFIREHHGTTPLTYFWHKAAEQGRDIGSPDEFHYPGPVPRTKETAMVMLADSVEAASRLVRDPSPDRFREVVRRIVQMKLEERQLEQAALTFRDLAVMEEHFVAVLSGIHHHRIEYPTSTSQPAEEDGAADPIPRVGRAPT